MDDFTEYPGRPQIHTGIGPQVGRDHIGDNHFELMDQGTKDLVVKMSKVAPGFANAIEMATREGVMSPSTVAALERAVENFNWDVVMMLRGVGEHINLDVADMLLRASRGINEDIADKLSYTATDLKRTAKELDSSLDSLRDMAVEIQHFQRNANHGPQASPELSRIPISAPLHVPSPGRRGTVWSKFKVFLCGTGVGLLGAMSLASHHLGTWAVPAVIATLGVPAMSVLNWYLNRTPRGVILEN